jgi:hypothetical protein
MFAVSSAYRDFSRLRNPAEGLDGPGVRGGDDDRVVLPNPHHVLKKQLVSVLDFFDKNSLFPWESIRQSTLCVNAITDAITDYHLKGSIRVLVGVLLTTGSSPPIYVH